MYRFPELISVLLLISIVHCDSSAIRQTQNGPVEGLEEVSVLGKKYYSFKGVPYAEVPITGTDPYTGAEVDRRFKATEPIARKWTEPFKTQAYGDNCIPTTHFFPKNRKSSENCLFVNIFVPAGGAEKKTVLVWIHGGGFTDGSGDDTIYGPDFMVEADTILVTMNYRLGIFGFMNLGFGEYTGNMGMKDQQMALKWIYENIEHFSGNKHEILLGGVSAGGASVQYHVINEDSRQYFKRALILSGAALDYFAFSEPNHLKRLQEFTKIDDKKQLIKYLKAADSNRLAECYPTPDFGTLLVSLPWVPTVESALTKGAFLTKTPEDILNSDDAPVMDILFSFASEESILFLPDIAVIEEPLISEDLLKSKVILPFYGFVKEYHPKEYKQAVKLLKDAYLPNTNDVKAIQRGNGDLLSEASINYGLFKSIKLHTKSNNRKGCSCNRRNTFVQRFSVNLDINMLKSFYKHTIKGATHADDLSFLFYAKYLDPKIYEEHLSDKNDPNYVMIMRMVEMVTNFARTGNPSIKGDTPFKSLTSPDEIFVQDITNDSKTSIVTDILQQIHYDTWEKVEKIYKKLQIVPEDEVDYCNAPACY